jgi:hypothetical protein
VSRNLALPVVASGTPQSFFCRKRNAFFDRDLRWLLRSERVSRVGGAWQLSLEGLGMRNAKGEMLRTGKLVKQKRWFVKS